MEDDSEGTDGVISTQPELVVRQLESAGELGDFDVLEDVSFVGRLHGAPLAYWLLLFFRLASSSSSACLHAW